MSKHLDKIIDFAQRLGLDILHCDEAEELIIVNNEDRGICSMVIDCEYPILIMEQLIYRLKNESEQHYKRLLQMNRNLVHGAFVIDDEGKNVIFRDTLQLENLDFNEFEGTVNALGLGLAEYSRELLSLNR